MKITFLMPTYPWCPMGGFRVVYEYANQLVRRGHDVTVVHPQAVKFGPGKTTSFYENLKDVIKARLHRGSKPVIDWQKIDPRVKLLYVSDTEPCNVPDGDAIFATAWNTVASVLRYADSKGAKFYLIQGYETFMGPKPLVDATWRAPLHKIVISRWLFALGQELGAKDLVYIPNAVDHDRYTVLTPIDDRPKRISMLFSNSAFKGSRDGIAALEIVKTKHPDLDVIFFGTGRHAKWIPKWIRYYRNPPQDFIVHEIYNKSRIFLNASWTEGFGLPPAEAACCGCAIVATDSGGIKGLHDFIEDGQTGLLSLPKDVKTLGENLCRVLDDENFRKKLAEAAGRRLSTFTWATNTLMMENFIESSRKVGAPESRNSETPLRHVYAGHIESKDA
ncbi:MAG: glycosyltransferase family 4 protein [Acidobacteriota bacterium]|nr:glycosyltransferase family 4 protein [Acidobacteriota bacterium]